MVFDLIVGSATLYLAFGIGFAAWFASAGVARIDPLARGSGLGFRLLIVPGAAALWPLLLRNVRLGHPPVERTAHDRAAEASP